MIINLHESVSIREHLLYKWYQGLLQDIDVHWGVHDAIENADASLAMHTNT